MQNSELTMKNHELTNEVRNSHACMTGRRPAAADRRALTSAGVPRVAPRHLARRYVVRVSGARCRRNRHAGGPTRANLCGCRGSGGQRVWKDYALGVRKEASCDAHSTKCRNGRFCTPHQRPPRRFQPKPSESHVLNWPNSKNLSPYGT